MLINFFDIRIVSPISARAPDLESKPLDAPNPNEIPSDILYNTDSSQSELITESIFPYVFSKPDWVTPVSNITLNSFAAFSLNPFKKKNATVIHRHVLF